jgi:hypothetical protein
MDNQTAGVDLDKLPRLYRFDRYQGACKLAEGIGVHATSMADAIEKAYELARKERMPADGIDLQFVSNEPCAAVRRCSICKAYEGARRAEPSVAADHDEAVQLLSAVFDAWENGDPCYEDPETQGGYLGMAFRLDDDVFNRCCALLNRLNPPRNAALASPAVSQKAAPVAPADWINAAVRDVAELPDRDSPDGQPDMMLVSADELRVIIERHASATQQAVGQMDGATVDAYTVALAVRDACLKVSADFRFPEAMRAAEALFKVRGLTSSLNLADIIATCQPTALTDQPSSGAMCQPAVTTASASIENESELQFNATRLRNVARLVGMESAIPRDNATLDGARGSVLGMIAGKLRTILAQQGAARVPSLDAILNCYSPDDTASDYQDKIREIYASHAANAGEDTEKPLAHGHRDDYYLLANARSLIESPKAETRRMPNWVLSMRLFATGSTSAHQICADAGIDPDGFKVDRAAIASSAAQEAK